MNETLELNATADISVMNAGAEFETDKRTAAVSSQNIESLSKTGAIKQESTLYNPVAPMPEQPTSVQVPGVPTDMLNEVNAFMNGGTSVAPEPTAPVAPVIGTPVMPEPVAPVAPVMGTSFIPEPTAPVAPMDTPVMPEPTAQEVPVESTVSPVPPASKNDNVEEEISEIRNMLSAFHDYIDELDDKFAKLEAQVMNKSKETGVPVVDKPVMPEPIAPAAPIMDASFAPEPAAPVAPIMGASFMPESIMPELQR